MADTEDRNALDLMDEWDYEELDCEAEMERQREVFKENIKRQVDKIIRSSVSSSAKKFDTVIKLRSINTLTTYPTTPFDTEEEAFE